MPPPHQDHAVGTIVNGQYRFSVRLARDVDKDVLRLVDIWVTHHNDIAYTPVQRPAWATPYRTYMQYDSEASYLWAEYRIDLTTPGLRTDGVYRLSYIVTDGALEVQCEYRIYMPYAHVPTGTGEAVAVYYATGDGNIYSNSLDFDAEELVADTPFINIADLALSDVHSVLAYGGSQAAGGLSGGRIRNLLTGSVTTVFGSSWVNGVAVDNDAGRVIWAEVTGSQVGIQSTELDGTGLTLLRWGDAQGIALDQDGYIYWTNYQGTPKTTLKRIRTDGSGYEVLFETVLYGSTIGTFANKLRVDAEAGLVFATHSDSNAELYSLWRYDLNDADPKATAVKMREWPYAGSIASAFALEIDRAAQRIYWSDPDGIKRARYDGSEEELLHSVSVRALALSFTGAGSGS